jgi:pimeloyl-ACP methyl ester carboxylesterase
VEAISGADDAVMRSFASTQRHALSAVQPDAQLQLIPRSGHWVMYESAELFNRVFMQNLEQMCAANRRIASPKRNPDPGRSHAS